jgi:hypothetical protein
MVFMTFIVLKSFGAIVYLLRDVTDPNGHFSTWRDENIVLGKSGREK